MSSIRVISLRSWPLPFRFNPSSLPAFFDARSPTSVANLFNIAANRALPVVSVAPREAYGVSSVSNLFAAKTYLLLDIWETVSTGDY